MREALLAAARAKVGTLIGARWQLDDVIAMGGMAAVFAAKDRDGSLVAVKMLLPQFAAVGSIRKRFMREAYVANTIDHPGVVTIIADATGDDGSVYLIMELLGGESMETLLRRSGGRLAAHDVLAFADQTLSVLSVAHAKGIIHRDLKPTNLFITPEGQIKILDFGLARFDSGAGPATAAGMVLGTTAYMPPEQAMGLPDQIDARSDIFTMGALMFRTLSGRYIREQLNGDDRLMAAMLEPAPALASMMPEAPAPLAALVDRALAFSRNGRFASAAEMRASVLEVYAALFSGFEPDSALSTRSFGHGS